MPEAWAPFLVVGEQNAMREGCARILILLRVGMAGTQSHWVVIIDGLVRISSRVGTRFDPGRDPL